jgi:hypothetical protein
MNAHISKKIFMNVHSSWITHNNILSQRINSYIKTFYGLKEISNQTGT